MRRNGGSVVDVERREVCDRDGVWYPLERIAVAGGSLYYARRNPDNTMFSSHERWLLPEAGWSVSRFAFHSHVEHMIDWYIEPDLIKVAGPVWRVQDCYLDVEVHEGSRYELRDADELAAGMIAGEIPLAEAAAALESLSLLCNVLRKHQFSGAALLREFAPGLPA